MEQQYYDGGPIYDFAYFFSAFVTFVNLAIPIVMLYYGIKLYRKLMKYMDRDNKS